MNPEETLRKLESEFKSVVDMLIKAKDANEICIISQTDIAKELNIYPAQVAKIFKRLYDDNCLAKIKRERYQILRTDLYKYGPLGKLMRLQTALKENPAMINMPYKEQSKILDITLKGLKSTYGLMYGTYGGVKSQVNNGLV